MHLDMLPHFSVVLFLQKMLFFQTLMHALADGLTGFEFGTTVDDASFRLLMMRKDSFVFSGMIGIDFHLRRISKTIHFIVTGT
mmetsp:Transcript_65608/g.189186  ORF Transcript_65608/g.189186 Transcript_65608/m.189186 type:complete len:83 (-) Transcript_65608:490-738(-)